VGVAVGGLPAARAGPVVTLAKNAIIARDVITSTINAHLKPGRKTALDVELFMRILSKNRRFEGHPGNP
jgi:hypothetical protein